MSNLIASAFHDIRRAKLKLEVAIKDSKYRSTKKFFSNYLAKLNFILLDFVSIPNWTPEMREALRQDFSSDQLTSEAVIQKMDYLSPEERDKVETIIDEMVAARKQKSEEILKQYKQ